MKHWNSWGRDSAVYTGVSLGAAIIRTISLYLRLQQQVVHLFSTFVISFYIWRFSFFHNVYNGNMFHICNVCLLSVLTWYFCNVPRAKYLNVIQKTSRLVWCLFWTSTSLRLVNMTRRDAGILALSRKYDGTQRVNQLVPPWFDVNRTLRWPIKTFVYPWWSTVIQRCMKLFGLKRSI